MFEPCGSFSEDAHEDIREPQNLKLAGPGFGFRVLGLGFRV